MIKVSIISSGEIVNGLEVKGHANFAEHGKDLVCAGVSCIITGGFNALNKEDVEVTVEFYYDIIAILSYKELEIKTLIEEMECEE